MDIQVSSNFERMLFVMNEARRRADRPSSCSGSAQTGRLTVEAEQRRALDRRRRSAPPARRRRRRSTRSRRVHADDRAADRSAHGDRHRRRPRLAAAGAHPVVTMATAHPAKFPDAVERATGVRPALPAHLADLFDRPERIEHAAQRPRRVEDFVRAASPR